MSRLKPIAALLLGAVCLIVVLQNTEAVETRILFATVAMPRALLLLTTTLAGFALGVLVALIWFRKGGKGGSS